MSQTSGMIEKMSGNRTRARLAHGEVNERRQRNDKRHKPARVSVDLERAGYTPANIKRLAARKRDLHHQAAYAYIEE